MILGTLLIALSVAQAAPLESLKKLDRAELQIKEPYSGELEVAQGWPIQQVMGHLFGPTWKEKSEWVFVCQDGYRAILPTRKLLDHRGLLATSWKGRGTFDVLKEVGGKKQKVPVGPYYLVWENIQDVEMAKEGDHGWPYQVVGIEAAEPVASRWVPDARASIRVRKGYEAFKSYCLNCHSVDAQGGKVGPELHVPVSAAKYYNPAFLPQWILNPASIRAGTPMPPYRPEADMSERKAEVQNVVAYLGWLAAEQEKNIQK